MADDVAAMTATASEAYVNANGMSSKGTRATLLGPQIVHFDTWRTVGWDVMTHGCFLTFPHHDAAGMLTYSHIRTGAKIWAYIHLAGVDHKDQKAVVEAWDKYYHVPMASETYDRNVKVGTVLHERGAVL